MEEYTINILWDNEADVWAAYSDDLTGLVLESGSYDALVERVRYAVPELLELNGKPFENVSLFFKSERHERVYK